MRHLILFCAVALTVCFGATSAFAVDATSFVDPAFFGNADTTSNEWDVFSSQVFNAPDVSADSTHGGSTLSVSGPGFVSGSSNFYAFSGNYNANADIVAPSVAAAGTHVVVQTSGTLGYSGVSSVQIFDDGGSLLSDSPFSETELFNGTVSSSFGPVTQVERMWEFWLPGYTGDFGVAWTNGQHSSFNGLRVDSLAASSTPAAAVPEPSSVVMISIALAGLCSVLRRRST